MDINSYLLLVAVIVFLGYLAEWGFRKINIPDTLLLILVGFIIGPNVLNYADPARLGTLAPLFTTFTLLFLMFDGSLSIDLKSFAEGIGAGITIGVTNFIISSLVVAGVFYLITADVISALMLGFALGGVSSAFIIPILKQVTVDKKLYSVLTLESALTDVLAIVFAITMIGLIDLPVFNIKSVFSQIASLFFVAGVVGIMGGFLWMYMEDKLVNGDSNYMMTVAYVVLIYFLAEYLGGNGAIAAMAFGIVIANSRILTEIGEKIKKPKKKQGEEEKKTRITNIVSRRERQFYQEISFFLKTFFFVYIGLLLNAENWKALLLGTAIAAAIMLLRNISWFLTKSYKPHERELVNALFARGIAPAAIVLLAKGKGLLGDALTTDTVYVVITATIIFSSARLFIYKRKLNKGAISRKNIDKS